MLHTIPISDDYYLSPAEESDIALFVKYLNDPEMYANTLRVPYPYEEKDARAFLAMCEASVKEHGRIMKWQIRKASGEMIGGIGFLCTHGVSSHREEIGFWMAPPYRGQGIMTRVLRVFSDRVAPEYGIIRLDAHVFAHNLASARALENAGFEQEGFLKKAYYKDGTFLDAWLYAKVR